jgi:hypothetical protein
LLHAPANCENQIAAVLHLIVGEVVTKAAALLLLKPNFNTVEDKIV